MITHYRIDCRLVHGQTTTVLRKQYPCDGIIVVDDPLVEDEMMCQAYKTAAGGNIRVLIYTIEKALIQLEKAEASAKNYYVVFRNALTVQTLIQRGYRFKGDITVGPQSARSGTIDYIFGISLTDEEAAAMDFISSQGINLLCNPFENRTSMPWEKVREKKQ